MNSIKPDSEPRSTGKAQTQMDAPRPNLEGASNQEVSVRIATSAQAVEQLRAVWQGWTRGLYTDIDYFLQALRVDETILRPYVISVWRGDAPLAILAGQVKSRQAFSIVSMVRIKGPRARVLEVSTKARLGPPSPEADEIFISQLCKALREGGVDLVSFQRLSLESQLFRSLGELPGLMRTRVPHVFSYSILSLTSVAGKRPPVFSGKIMREARRKTSNLERAFPGQVRLRCFSNIHEFDDGLRDAVRVKVATWQHLLDVGFADTLPTPGRFRFFAQKGWLRIFVLYVAERPCAFLIGHRYGKVFYCQHAGFDTDYEKLSVGSVLTTWAFESLATSGVESVDLGEGGQEHNRRLGCERIDEGTVHVYAPTVRGLNLALFFGAAQISRSMGRAVRSGLHLNWAAKIWREFLTERRSKTRSPVSNSNRRLHNSLQRTS